MNIFRTRLPELAIASAMGLGLMVISSSLMFFVEHEAQPEAFSSIPATMWWAVATLTTVGYGDIYPVTSLGKFLGAFIAFLGLGLFALPAGIIASGFSEAMKGHFEAKGPCPLCGQEKPSDDPHTHDEAA